MTDRRIRHIAREFCRKTKLYTMDYYSVKSCLSAQGISVIEYNHIYNSDNVDKLLKTLNVSDNFLRSRGFSYADKKRYLIFVHEDLSKKEKLEVLLRECAHFALEHKKTMPIVGMDTKENYEANIFAMFVLERTAFDRIAYSIIRWLKIIFAVLALVALVIGTALFVRHEISEAKYYGDYYIVAGDASYHTKDCAVVSAVPDAVRFTDNQHESGYYSPCPYCIG